MADSGKVFSCFFRYSSSSCREFTSSYLVASKPLNLKDRPLRVIWQTGTDDAATARLWNNKAMLKKTVFTNFGVQ